MPLIVVPTPIGNLGDITLRALEALRSADVIACEDTRRTLKLLNHYEIRKPLVSYHRHNERSRTSELISRVEAGETVALVSDAGTPGISDPGYILIEEIISRSLPLDVLPGANALLPALLLSGVAPQPFTFCGFLDGSAKERAERLAELSERKDTLIFYIAPHGLVAELRFFTETLGERRAALVREISKVHQEAIRGTLPEIIAICKTRTVKGEMILVVEGRKGEREPDVEWRDEAMRMKALGIFDKEIANVLSASYGIARNQVKKFLLSHEGDMSDEQK